LGTETLQANGTFFVESTSLEELNTRANYSLLTQMATASDGAFYTINDLDKLASDINAHPKLKPVESIKSRSLALIDLKRFFFLMVLFFSAEWLLRRYFGRI
jgi:hypothetical protein